ncbi:sulfotransferase [Paraglaciecola sp.]|uniref:tetratricopeptide repeat-containing sulfotransferase family protein n=1 Tax=Paraglaciecola sp. TaxID=1920173 RepID=UPI00273D5533|nr:sulfotransferase [Paraglaciecola sp.]MDP5029548.1 sulfotransferase [Paraglaciecola sp.]
MNTTFESEIQRIVALYQKNQYGQAKQACLSLLPVLDDLEPIYWILFQITSFQKQYDEAFYYINKLIQFLPTEMVYYSDKANLYEALGHRQQAIDTYVNFIKIRPEHAIAHYNLAILLKKSGKILDALEHYHLALSLNIQEPAEVYVNIGVIYSELNESKKAKESYLLALGLDYYYIAAWFNLGGLYEELGEKREALECYEKIIKLEPSNTKAIVRILQAKDDVGLTDSLVTKLESLVMLKSNLTVLDRESAYYALGKVYNDNRQFESAFEFYRKANELNRIRAVGYDKNKRKDDTINLISDIDKSWIIKNSLDVKTSRPLPIFICGMFRSGSTLAGKILCSHPNITSGGEMNHFYQSIKESNYNALTNFRDLKKSELNRIRKLYKDKLNAFYPGASKIIDKRPDNFWYLGLIETILPDSKFICTDREPLDICLSIYFNQFSADVGYGTDLLDIAHYYVEFRKILLHWQSLIPNSIYVLQYDKLVKSPDTTCREMFEHCGLDWDSKYLDGGKGNYLIKTASIWQVRKPLYKTSSKRWINYQNKVLKAKQYLDDNLPN